MGVFSIKKNIYMSLATACADFSLNSDVNIQIIVPFPYIASQHGKAPEFELVTRKCVVSSYMKEGIKRSWTEQGKKVGHCFKEYSF